MSDLANIMDAFRQFSRNGRWGTCSDCPRDTHGRAYPEACRETSRDDHALDVDALAEQFKRRTAPQPASKPAPAEVKCATCDGERVVPAHHWMHGRQDRPCPDCGGSGRRAT